MSTPTIKLLVIVPGDDDDYGEETMRKPVNAILEPGTTIPPGGQPCWRLWADSRFFPGFSGDEVFGGDVGYAVSEAVRHLRELLGATSDDPPAEPEQAAPNGAWTTDNFPSGLQRPPITLPPVIPPGMPG